MRFPLSNAFLLLGTAASSAAFVPGLSSTPRSSLVMRGYLDDISPELAGEDPNPVPEEESREATKMEKEQLDRYGPGSFQDFVDFNEFDGGDGQMGVAGDGSKGLEKFGRDVQPQLAKSKAMSAKNAWGTSTGYADELLQKDPKMDTARAQQLENWMNQQEILARNKAQREMTENFDQVASHDEDWRTLAKFGVERNEEFDLDEEFGPILAGDQIDGTIELKTAVNRVEIYEMPLKNEYMGFADFRAAFTPQTPMDWTVEPNEGSLSKEPTNFVIKFRPQGPGISEGFLVIDTEDMKKTYRVIGSTG